MAPGILQARMLDDKPLEDILDVFDFLCQKQGDDNYTAILIEIEEKRGKMRKILLGIDLAIYSLWTPYWEAE